MRLLGITLFALLCLPAAAVADGEKTYFACYHVPFSGFYESGRFQSIEPINLSPKHDLFGPFDTRPVEKFVQSLPSVFPKGKKLRALSAAGKKRSLTVKNVRTTWYGDIIIQPPIEYQETVADSGEDSASLVWTGNLDVTRLKPEEVAVPADAADHIRAILNGELLHLEESLTETYGRLPKPVLRDGIYPKPLGYVLPGDPSRIYIVMTAHLNDFIRGSDIKTKENPVSISMLFIYAAREKKMIYSLAELFQAYDTSSGESLSPVLFFRIAGDRAAYILASHFDGYESHACRILDAADGRLLLGSF